MFHGVRDSGFLFADRFPPHRCSCGTWNGFIFKFHVAWSPVSPLVLGTEPRTFSLSCNISFCDISWHGFLSCPICKAWTYDTPASASQRTEIISISVRPCLKILRNRDVVKYMPVWFNPSYGVGRERQVKEECQSGIWVIKELYNPESLFRIHFRLHVIFSLNTMTFRNKYKGPLEIMDIINGT